LPTATTASTVSRPRFRTDLVAEPIDEDGQRYIDVIDPDTGNGFRFYEVEYSLACAMDGERDVAGLMTWAHEELGITPTSSELASVIATLGDLGYLELGVASLGDVAVGPGVVVPTAASARPSIDVELGSPGATLQGRASPLDKVPQVDDLMLGSAGTSAPSAPVPARPAAADLLGPAGAARVDLSADLAVGAADVKEAVRASKVMKAAELPKDLQAALATADEPITPRVKPVEPVKAPVKAPVAPVAAPVTAKEPPRPAKDPTRPPVELAKEPPRVKHPTVPPPDTGGRTSPVLIFLLVLVILGAGGFAFWKYYWVPRQQKQAEATSTPTVPVVKDGSGSAAIQPEVPPPPLAGVLSISTPAPLDIQSPLAGAVASIAADGVAVNQGDEIVRIVGAEKAAAQLKDLNGDITRVQNQLDKLNKQRADATGGAATRLDVQIKDRTDSLATKQEDKTRLEAEIEKRVIRAPAAGTIKPVATKGKKVAENDVLATIQPTGAPTATFEPLRAEQKFTADQAITLNIEGAAEGQPQTIACKVVEVAGAKLVVECPDGAPDGTKVFLP
jgi:hypothetical protein